MVVSRFAPAPTGFLHLGHVVNALHVWGITRAAGGRVLLRIEDHDRQRSRPEYEAALLDDLDWLGFVPDDPSTAEFRAGRCRGRQSDRQAVYARAFSTLQASGVLYGCDCSRRQLREGEPGPPGISGGLDMELRYSGRCRRRNLPLAAGVGIRVRLERSRERFDDLRHGVQAQNPAEQCGDLLVRDREGNWTYQFAVVVDDMDQGVSLVIRGDDLLASTGRQIQLARLLGRSAPPQFLHHALIMKSATRKLSKADRDTSVRDLRTAGATPDAVIGHAMRAAGLTAAATPLARDAAEALIARRYFAALDRLRD